MENNLAILEADSPSKAIVAEVEAMTTEDIERRFAAATLRTAQGLVEMAACVKVLESRGYDLSGLKMAIMPYLRLIAEGQLLPEILLRYASNHALLGAVSGLPVSDQRVLLSRGVIAISVVEADRSIGVREIDPRALSRAEISRVFSAGRIIPPREQELQPRPRRQVKRRVVIDAKKRTLSISGVTAPIADIFSAMADAAGRQGEIDVRDVNAPSVGARLTEQERERMRAACKAMRLDEPEFVRRAILTWLI